MAESCELVRSSLGAQFVSVLELDSAAQQLRVVGEVGWSPPAVGITVPSDPRGSVSGFTLGTRDTVTVGDLTREDRFEVPASLTERGAVSALAVRIGEIERPYGVLATFSVLPSFFGPDDAGFLQAVANTLAAAVDRLRLDSELRASRDHLSAVLTSINEGITVQGPDGRLIYANDAAARITGFETGDQLVAAPLEEVIARFELYDDNGAPITPADLPSRRALAGETPDPMLIGYRIRGTGEVGWSMVAATPVRSSGGDLYRVVNTFRDVSAERWTRERRAFIAEAAVVMSSTLDTMEAARRLADLAVPRLADYCTVDLVEPGNTIVHVALAHVDPDRLRLARRARELRPVRFDAPAGPGRVIREGESEFMAFIPPELIEQSLQGEELELARDLGLRSYICVPLRGREGPIGALSLVMAESGRTLTERDLALAEELGQNAGIALENAGLFQAADDRRAELDAILGALAEAVLVYDSRGRLRLSNKAAADLFEDVPRTLKELLRDRLAVDETEARDDGGETPNEVQIDGQGSWFELRRYGAPPITGRQRRRLAPTVIVLHDISGQLAARAARDAFMGVLSHELRTPITTIYGGSELLERGLDEAHQAEVIADIRSESERLVRLVEDLLVMSRVERDMVEIADEPILLQHLLGSVVHAFEGRLAGVRISLDVGERLPSVRGDTTYIEQVVRNLLTNAVRYGAGVEKGVEVRASNEDGRVAVRVLDRGPGFGEADVGRLFELFYRTDSARAVPGGAGIGLFVCRQLIEAMGGEIWARPRRGGGAEFGFWLPVMESDLSI
jgi:PAS domain S-box-containing protein